MLGASLGSRLLLVFLTPLSLPSTMHFPPTAFPSLARSRAVLLQSSKLVAATDHCIHTFFRKLYHKNHSTNYPNPAKYSHMYQSVKSCKNAAFENKMFLAREACCFVQWISDPAENRLWPPCPSSWFYRTRTVSLSCDSGTGAMPGEAMAWYCHQRGASIAPQRPQCLSWAPAASDKACAARLDRSSSSLGSLKALQPHVLPWVLPPSARPAGVTQSVQSRCQLFRRRLENVTVVEGKYNLFYEL